MVKEFFILVWRTIKDRKITIIVYCLAVIAFLWMYVGLFPAFRDQSATFNEMMKSYPQDFMKAFGVENIDMSSLESFLAMEQFGIIWPLMVSFLMISLAGIMLAGEIEKGTSELLLSRPVSRQQIFWSRYLVGIAVLIVFVFCSVMAVIPFAKIYKVDYLINNFWTMSMACFLFGWAIFSIAFMFSAIFSERSRVYMLAGGLLVLMYVIKIISSLKESLENLKYFSFFYYYDANRALVENIIDGKSWVVFMSVAVVCTVIGMVVFRKRDVAV
ncbi:MAG: ABC transporter permease subunit [Patescibacteria group bacterium]|jgi:ABC-2 type transport system permease protein